MYVNVRVHGFCMYAHVCAHVYVHVCMCACMCVSGCVCVCICMWAVYLCVCMCMHVYVYVCMCLYVSVCMCVWSVYICAWCVCVWCLACLLQHYITPLQVHLSFPPHCKLPVVRTVSLYFLPLTSLLDIRHICRYLSGCLCSHICMDTGLWCVLGLLLPQLDIIK